MFTSVELCAGAGGQALGLEMAGFAHERLIEIDATACETLRANRPEWDVRQCDVHDFAAHDLRGIDLLAGGVPCPPFSRAGKQLGHADERDLFPQAVRIIDECRPSAIMLENVRGLLDTVFADYRNKLVNDLAKLGYIGEWKLLNASNYGVSQLRPRAVFVGLKNHLTDGFRWPSPASVCNEGANNITLTRPELTKLQTQVRRGTSVDQLEVLKWLIQKFPQKALELTRKPTS